MATALCQESSSSEDEEEWLMMENWNLFHTPKEYKERFHPFNTMEEEQFRARFRLSKATVLALLSEIEHALEFTSDYNQSMTPMNQLLLALRYYATGTFQMVLGDLLGVHKSTACRVIHKVTRAIAGLRSKYAKLPTSEEERKATREAFYASSSFPGVVGAIDCTHVPIQSPGGGENGEIYRNRKGWFSINVQLVTDPTLYITNVVARWHGSAHDSTIFDFSRLKAECEAGVLGGDHLIGDGGYALTDYLLTPVAIPTTSGEKKYNEAHKLARNCIERTNGLLKRRFASLKYGMRLQVKNILPVIVACVVLHNVAICFREEEPPEDQEMVEIIQERRRQGLRTAYEDFDDDEPISAVAAAGARTKREALILGHFD